MAESAAIFKEKWKLAREDKDYLKQKKIISRSMDKVGPSPFNSS